MPRIQVTIAASCLAFLWQACAPAPAPVMLPPPGKEIYRTAAQRMTAVIISASPNVDSWARGRFSKVDAPKDADGGSAAPITSDGYFLTADHVLAGAKGRNIFVLYGSRGRLGATKARIVWRSPATDLALLHSPISTPEYYEWSAPSQWLPQGFPVMHAGVSTGFQSVAGKLITPIPPETRLSSARRFKYDIPLAPGDSGGAVVGANGRLIGVNSAVEFLVPLETAFFIESEANRPNVGKLNAIIAADRRSSGR